MRFDAERHGARLELRLLELEDTVHALTGIVGTMTDMLHRLNGITSHYVGTVTALTLTLPRADRPSQPPPTPVLAEPGAGRCGGDCACAAHDPDDDGRC